MLSGGNVYIHTNIHIYVCTHTHTIADSCGENWPHKKEAREENKRKSAIAEIKQRNKMYNKAMANKRYGKNTYIRTYHI